MNKENLLMFLKSERDYSERQVFSEIKVLQRKLDSLKNNIEKGSFTADDGLQGNEWRLYKELSNLERLEQFIENLERLEDK